MKFQIDCPDILLHNILKLLCQLKKKKNLKGYVLYPEFQMWFMQEGLLRTSVTGRSSEKKSQSKDPAYRLTQVNKHFKLKWEGFKYVFFNDASS